MKQLLVEEKTFPSDPMETRECLRLTLPEQDHPWPPSYGVHTSEGLHRCLPQGHALLQPMQDPLQLLAHRLWLESRGKKRMKQG